MALTTRQRSIHNKNSAKRSSFNKGKRKVSEGDIIVTSAPTELRSIWYPRGALALSLLLCARLLAVYFGIIGDCDETYNYWEPLHYLIYGNGLQTWEYSPDYAIRSYAYLWLFAVPGKLWSFFLEPATLFYALKTYIAVFTAMAELSFYKAVCHEFGVHVGRVWLACSVTAAGAGAAAPSLLPAALANALAGAALAAAWRQRLPPAVLLTAANALLGWPFTAILGLPIAIDMIILKQQYSEFMKTALKSLVGILVPMVAIDSWYYGKLVIAPLNIVMYNIFSEHGPTLYGTEPWTYYFVNGFLNLNIVWIAALASPLALALWHYVAPRGSIRGSLTLPYWLHLLPLFLWLAIFMVQPHKEERFLYPVYSLIILAGAITVDCLQKIVYTVGGSMFSGRPRHYLSYTTVLAVLFVAVAGIMGVSRSVAQYRNYGAAARLPQRLPQRLPPAAAPAYVCWGKEWHRAPPSLLLPRGYRTRLVASDFDGQLPAPYADAYNATRLRPAHFNSANRGDPRTYLKPSQCHYLVDSELSPPSTLQPPYYRDAAVWERVAALPVLLPDRSHRLFRAFYVPYLSEKYTAFGNLYLLKNRFI